MMSGLQYTSNTFLSEYKRIFVVMEEKRERIKQFQVLRENLENNGYLLYPLIFQ